MDNTVEPYKNAHCVSEKIFEISQQDLDFYDNGSGMNFAGKKYMFQLHLSVLYVEKIKNCTCNRTHTL